MCSQHRRPGAKGPQRPAHEHAASVAVAASAFRAASCVSLPTSLGARMYSKPAKPARLSRRRLLEEAARRARAEASQPRGSSSSREEPGLRRGEGREERRFQVRARNQRWWGSEAEQAAREA